MCIFDAEWLPEQSRCSEAGKTGLRPRSSLLLWAPMEGLSCQTWGASWRPAAGSSWPWRNPVPRHAVCLLLRALLTRGFPASVSASFPPLSVRIACSALRKTKRGWKQTGVGRHGEDQLIMASSSPASSSLSGPARLHARGVGGILVRSGLAVFPSSQLTHLTPRQRPQSRKPPSVRQEFTAMVSKGA